MIVLQNKIIADWFTDRWFMWAISVSVAAYPIGVGLAQLVLPPLALAYGWQVCFLSGAIPIAVALVMFLGSFRSSPLTHRHARSDYRAHTSASCCWSPASSGPPILPAIRHTPDTFHQ